MVDRARRGRAAPGHLVEVILPDVPRIRADFDRIASLPAGSDHSRPYHHILLDAIPPGATDALDVGCGRGEFTRELARRVQHVVGIDVSPRMLAAARAAVPGATFLEGDIAGFPLAAEAFDVITAITVLHHLAVEDVIPKLVASLRPGGVLAVLDVRRHATPIDWALLPLEAGAAVLQQLAADGRLVPSRDVRNAWADHGRGERYLSMAEARALARRLPGARVRRHLLYRYSLVWRKPA